MSIPAVNWAIAQQLKPTQKLALLALAHRQHQKTRQCNPSSSTLMADIDPDDTVDGRRRERRPVPEFVSP